MNLDKTDLNLFVVFDALYREKSVTQVANSLGLTQSAVSNALRRLRETLNDPLFVRTPDGMSPTPLSENIAPDVRRALSLLGKSARSENHFVPETSEKIVRLGMNDLAGALVLPGLIRGIQDQAPNMKVSNYYADRESATDDLRSGRIDLLLDSPIVNARSFDFEGLTKIDYVVMMREGHALQRRKMSMKTYLSAKHVHVSSRKKGRGHVDIALNNLGHQRALVARVRDYAVAATITQETDLLWTAPRALSAYYSLKVKELPFDTDRLEWNLYWKKSTDNDPALQWVRELIKYSAQELA